VSAEIRVDAFLPHPPKKVWQALTDPALLAQWLMPNDFQPRLGHRFTFRTDPAPDFDGVVHCQVIAISPCELLRISWVGGPGIDSTVTWQLAAEGRGTRLFLTHEGFDDTDPRQKAVWRLLDGGWRSHLIRRLERILYSLP
jgi:uncharacterized protein YndB with AHSA1/START domain